MRASFLRQGGGLYITGSSTEVTLTTCNIYSNEAFNNVSTCAKTHQNLSTCHFLELSPIAPLNSPLRAFVCGRMYVEPRAGASVDLGK